MEGGQDPPPPLMLPPENPPYLFTPQLPPPPPSMLQTPLDPQGLPDIDWANLFSGQDSLLPMSECASSSSISSSLMAANNGAEDEKGNKEKKKVGRLKKNITPRFAFQTRSADDILDDGFRWRKYGQKAVKNSIYPRYVNGKLVFIYLFTLHVDGSVISSENIYFGLYM